MTSLPLPDSPWQACFLHALHLPAGLSPEALPSRDLVLACGLGEGETPGRLKAVNVAVVG